MDPLVSIYNSIYPQKENEQFARGKRYEDEFKKLEIERKEQELKKKFEDIRFYDEIKRVSEVEQKKSYQNILDQQVNTSFQLRII